MGGVFMAKQTEITINIKKGISSVKNKLESLGFVEIEKYTGIDNYFTTISGEISSTDYKTLLDSSIIIRSFSSKSKKDKTNLMVYKNKSLDKNGVVLSEEKISTTVENLDNTLKILKLAGLNNWLSLNQQNSFYKLGEIEITVGTVKGLDGTFLEIEEYPSISMLSPEEKIEKMVEIIKKLGFDSGNDYSVKKAYMLFKKNLEETSVQEKRQ